MSVDVSGMQDQVREFARERAERAAERFVEVAKSLAPRRTGAGADSIAVESVMESSSGFTARIVVGEVYMAYQNFGTGIYGPKGTRIVAVNGDFLYFDSAIMGLIRKYSVAGTEPTHFWERTVDQWSSILEAT